MSDRIPFGYSEVWMKFALTGDLEAMYCSLGLATGGWTPDQSSVDAILTIVRDAFKACTTSAYMVGPGHIIVGSTTGDLRWDGTITPVAGTNGTTGCPQNVALLVKKSTSLGGRRGRGRSYVPGVAESNVSETGVIAAGCKTLANGALATMLTSLMALSSVEFAVLLHNSAPFTPTQINSMMVQDVCATQRRRLRR